MKILIMTFSPSGNTDKVGVSLKNKLLSHGNEVQYLKLAGNSDYFKSEDKETFLERIVKPHDLLIIGSPVYAHHLQYHVKELISQLPFPNKKWSEAVIPFVSYGGISSGIALEEAGKLFKKRNRKILMGAKISMSHKMTRAFMENEYDCSQAHLVELLINELVETIIKFDGQTVIDLSKQLTYKSRIEYIKAMVIFNEKKWHAKRYPLVLIDNNKCTACAACIKGCPVGHLEIDKMNKVLKSDNYDCIHCFNCVVACKENAVYLKGDLEKAKQLINKMTLKEKETPSTVIFNRKK